MSWYSECPLSYIDFGFILNVLKEHLEFEGETHKDRLERIIRDLETWLQEE